MTSDEVEDAGASWTLEDVGVEMEAIPREAGDLRVRFRDDDETVLALIYERGFWQSRTKKGEIGNKLAKATEYSDSKIKDELEDVWTDLTENSEDYQASLVAPSVDELIRNTERVENYAGEEREIHVHIKGTPKGKLEDGREADGGAETRKLVFQNSEWVRDSGDTTVPPVVEKYSNVFFEVLDITWQEWSEDIRDAWQDMQVRVDDGMDTAADRIAVAVGSMLTQKLTPHTDPDKVLNGDWNGWYEEDDEHGAIVWVPGTTLDKAMDSNNKDIEYRSKLSTALQEQGFTVGGSWNTTISGERTYVYPFLPESLGIEPIDVVGYDDDEDDDEPAESGADGGDGDDGDDGDDAGADEGQDEPESREGAEEPAAESTPTPPPDPDPSPASDPAQADGAAAALDGPLGEVVSLIKSRASVGDGVSEPTIVAEAASGQGIGPPADVKECIKTGVSEGVLFRPENEENTIAVRPGAEAPAPTGGLDTSEEGVPEP